MDFNGIALAGVPGAGKSALAKKLAQIFNWQIISVGDLWRQRLHKSGNDKLMGFEEYWRQVPKDDNLAMDLQIEKIFAQGSVIGECRFAKHLQKYPLLLVFVTADIDTRAKYKMDKYGGKTAGEIKEILKLRESDELEVGRKLYGYDYRDPEIYHLVLNSAMMSLGEEIASVAGIVGKP